MSAPTEGAGSYGSPAPLVPHGPTVRSAPPVPSGPSRRTLAVVAVVLGLAVVFAGTYLAGRLTAPTAAAVSSPASGAATSAVSPTASGPSPSMRAGFTLTGSTLSGPGFTARMPSGWTIGADNGVANNDGTIENGSASSLAFFATDPATASARCDRSAQSFRTKLGGTVVELANVPWGTGTAVVRELETTYSTGQAIGIDIYCVERADGTSATILSIAAPEHQATNKAAAEALLATWTWT